MSKNRIYKKWPKKSQNCTKMKLDVKSVKMKCCRYQPKSIFLVPLFQSVLRFNESQNHVFFSEFVESSRNAVFSQKIYNQSIEILFKICLNYVFEIAQLSLEKYLLATSNFILCTERTTKKKLWFSIAESCLILTRSMN